ncbi:MAG: site-specific DNA-methyltransferase, partial [Bacteroidales bacterium]|nr:site-specific DNA-methyltransferase [Bacteroidales bacterium]
RIKCIYIDPPYNTGNENWVYNDNVNSPKIRKWLGQVVGKEAEDLTRHDKWLCMMYPRLVLLQKLLSDDGAIFISIDDNEQANLKLICDEIFGAGNFVAEFIWQKRKGGGNDSNYVATDHEYIISYVKDNKFQTKWRVAYDDEYLKRYKLEDEIGKYYYDTLSRPGLNNPIIYDVICPDGSIIKNGTWQISETKYYEELKSKNVDFIKNKQGGYTVVRKVRIPTEGKVLRSILSDCTNKNAADEMQLIFGNKKAFSTPKPINLIKTIIQLISSKNSIILDSFAGSGTTAHAVLNLNKADGGNRKFILVEMEDYAETITAERVRRVIKGYGEDKNAVEGTGGNFSFYELGEPVFNNDGYLNENIGESKLREYIWFTETRTPYRAVSNDYYLGNLNGTAYYFYYRKDEITTLSHDTLNIIGSKSDTYVVYADQCVIDNEWLSAHNITFKKIPRDIRKF